MSSIPIVKANFIQILQLALSPHFSSCVFFLVFKTDFKPKTDIVFSSFSFLSELFSSLPFLCSSHSLLCQRWMAFLTCLHLAPTTITTTWASPSSSSPSPAAQQSRLLPHRCRHCPTLRRHTVARLAVDSPSFPVCTTRAWCPPLSAPSWWTSSLWWHRSSTSSMQWTGCWRSSPCRSSTSTTHLSAATPTASRWSHRWHQTQRCPSRFTSGWGTSWRGPASHRPSSLVWPSTEPRWGGETDGPE